MEPFWAEVAAQLEENSIHVTLWTTLDREQERFRQFAPNAAFLDHERLMREVPTQLCALAQHTGPRPALAPPKLASLEVLALDMMERLDVNDSFPYIERVHHLHSLVSTWADVLISLKPDLVVFKSAPHMVYDFVIYRLCKLLRIPALHFHQTGLSMRVLPVLNGRYFSDVFSTASSPSNHSGDKRFDDAATCGPTIHPAHPPRTTPGLAEPDYMIRQRETDRRTFFSYYFHYLKSGIAGVTKSIAGRTVPSVAVMHKVRGKPLDVRTVAALPFLVGQTSALIRQAALKRHYEQLARGFEMPQQPFVFLPLHLQPERTTSPDGEFFSRQVLVARILSRALPLGWRLLIKDHLSQYRRQFAQVAAYRRSAEYFARLRELPNVTLVPLSHASSQLIDKAEIVATVSGTVGWEALVRGRPVLVFGNAWYGECEGVLRVHDESDLTRAFDMYRSGAFLVASGAVARFTERLDRSALHGVVYGSAQLDAADLTHNVREYVRFIAAAVNGSAAAREPSCARSFGSA